MEYCTKGNLRHLLLKPKNISGLEEQDVRDILGDVSGGLQHLHNMKITHRDIKPDNIVLQHCTERKNHTIYKIIDLGYAKELSDSTVSFVGTLHYLAPEIFETVRYDSSVDYWSMGILTFEIICGFLPFLPQLNPAERYILFIYSLFNLKINILFFHIIYPNKRTFALINRNFVFVKMLE